LGLARKEWQDRLELLISGKGSMTRCKSGTLLLLEYSEGGSSHQQGARIKYHRNLSSIILLIILYLLRQLFVSGKGKTAKSSYTKVML